VSLAIQGLSESISSLNGYFCHRLPPDGAGPLKKETAMGKFKMTLDDVVLDMRDRGMKMGKKTLADAIESGYFPFGKVISIGANGVRNILIMRKDYENWADQYLKEGT
jgi:hypothetical protein